jgi:phosphatidate cytidylyltransferase
MEMKEIRKKLELQWKIWKERWKREKEFNKRIVTSVGLILLLLAVAIINNPYLMGLLFAVINGFGSWESNRLMYGEGLGFRLAVAGGVIAIFLPPVAVATFVLLVGAGLVAYFRKPIGELGILFYPFVPLMAGLDLYKGSGIGVIGWLVALGILADVGAYVFGKLFGRQFISRPFSPTSPNKSWEGVIGGVGVATIVGGLISLPFFPIYLALLFSFFGAVFGVLGDLFESYLKRLAGVKDSGKILPGHGGVLDRIDSHLFLLMYGWGLMILGLI